MKIFVTGGAGFIGSHICRRFLKEGHAVTAFDNLSLGREELIADLRADKNFRFVKADLRDLEAVKQEMAGHEMVYHLAANSDISQGAANTRVDLENGTIATYNVLEAMRVTGPKRLVFSSTSAIYGEAEKKPTPEDHGPLLPISFYGASKLACEALVSSFAHNCQFETWIYRFANIVGAPSTHGAIHDFITKLQKNPNRLDVLGNGTQKKSYLHVSDCIDGMIFGERKTKGECQLFNLASEGYTTVRFIAEEVVRQMKAATGVEAEIAFGTEDRGWRGDVPFTWLDGSKLSALGWQAKLKSDEAVRKAVTEVIKERLKA